MSSLNTFFGWAGILLGVIFLCAFWPLGLVFIIMGIFCLAAAENENYTRIPIARQGRTMDFGPGGPPWGDREPTIPSGDRTIFASAIRSICEWGPTGPEVEERGSKRREIPGTARPASIAVTLHSGESYAVTGAAAERLRKWFDKEA